jgi:hypothetical protein
VRSRKEPLYRRVNTRTCGVSHRGGEFRWSRHPKREDPSSHGSMHGHKHHGLDYTPLFRFLLSKVGADFAEVYREAASRLDRPDPICWLVARSDKDKQAYVRIGESSYYSGLYVDENGRLALVDPSLRLEGMEPRCSCCTHTERCRFQTTFPRRLSRLGPAWVERHATSARGRLPRNGSGGTARALRSRPQSLWRRSHRRLGKS